MLPQVVDVLVVGSGPAGLAAAVAAKRGGAERVLIVERDREAGGILQQCIHNGFGVELLKEDLPGPSYAQHFIDQARRLGIELLLDAMVLEVQVPFVAHAISRGQGYIEVQARALVVATGARERTRAQIRLPGTRPAGVYTAGMAQRFVNVEGFMPGKRFVILGSGDIGMIMARRLTFEGATVDRVIEIMPYLTGLTRNYVQCLLDLEIPLHLSHTVGRVIGGSRVEAVETVQVDAQRRPVPGTEEVVPCDTLLLSVGLLPEVELLQTLGAALDPITGGPVVDQSMQTTVHGLFAAGNVVHIYDLVDWVTEAGLLAGTSAALYARGELHGGLQHVAARPIHVRVGNNVRYVVPQLLDAGCLSQGEHKIQLRVLHPVEEPAWVRVVAGNEQIVRKALRYARPGEMITVVMDSKAVERLRLGEELTVSVLPR